MARREVERSHPQKLANQLARVQRNEQERHCVSHKVRVKTNQHWRLPSDLRTRPTNRERVGKRHTEAETQREGGRGENYFIA